MNTMKKTHIRLGIIVAVLSCVISGFLFHIWRQVEGETVYAPGYTIEKWSMIETNMQKVRVWELIGPPLDYDIEWGYSDGEEGWDRYLWSRPKDGVGCFSCIWFESNKVARKQVWHDD